MVRKRKPRVPSGGSDQNRGGTTGTRAKKRGVTSCRNSKKVKKIQRKSRRDVGKNRKAKKVILQDGSGFDIQKLLGKTGIEFHLPYRNFTGAGTHLEKRLAQGDRGINRLDEVARQHDIDYSQAKSLKDKHVADRKMIDSIKAFPGKKTLTEKMVKHIMNTKLKLKL